MGSLGVEYKGRGFGGRIAAGQSGFHFIDGVKRYAGVGATIQAQHRSAEPGRDVHRLRRVERAGLADRPRKHR